MPDFLRIGDAERDDAISILQEHHLAGRLTTEEYEDRMSRALDAKVATDLAVLFTDLPGRRPAAPQVQQAPDVTDLPVAYQSDAPVLAGRPHSRPWYAQWWMLILAVVVSGATDGRLAILVPLAVVWIWLVYPKVVAPRRTLGTVRTTRPLTIEEREQVLHLIRSGARVDAIRRFRELTGADYGWAKQATEAMAREIGR